MRQALLAALLLVPALAVAEEPELDYTRLENGLDLLVVEKHTAPIVTIEVAVKTGSFTETRDTNGLSHLYEHMFFKGNAALPTQKMYMDRVAELGISFNGTTSTERVNYFITLPSRNFAAGMRFMADALLSPLFNEAELKSEHKVVIGEYDRNEANPSHYLWAGLREHLYGADAYRKNPLGERSVILSATRETMRAFRETYYVPNNSLLLVVGDVNATEAKVLAEQLFGVRAWKEGPNPHAVPRAPLSRLQETAAFPVVQDTPIVSLGVKWPGPDVRRDERSTFVADVWGTLLGFPHGRFQRTFRDGGLADRASLGYYTQREGGEIAFDAVVRDGKVFEVRDTLLAEIAAMAESGYWTTDDLALAKRTLKIDRAYAAESGSRLAHNLSFWWASSSLDYYRNYLDRIDSVTLEELREFVRNYLVGRPLVIGSLANEENTTRLGITAESLRPVPTGAMAEATAVESFALDNGVRVLLRSEPGADVSALQVMIDGGCLDLRPEQQGIDKLLLSTVMDGSKQLPRDELQARLVALGARHTADTNYDYSRISIVAPAPGFQESVSLLAECLREPALDPVAVAQRRSQMLTALGSEKGKADDYVVRVLNNVFFADHPYRLRPDGTAETVGALTPDMLRGRLAELLVGGRMLLVMVSDMDGGTARRVLNEEFGFVPAKEWSRPQVPPFTPHGLAGFEQRDLPTTYVMGKSAAPAPGHPDYPAAQLALSILRKRLWETLRTKHALTYAPRAGMSVYRSNYTYLSASTTQPTRAVELMHQAIRGLQEKLVEKRELQGQIAQAETRLHARSESAVRHAMELGHSELTGGSWRSHYDRPIALSRVTPEDVRRVARTYLKDFAFGVIGPSPVEEQVLRGSVGGSK